MVLIYEGKYPIFTEKMEEGFFVHELKPDLKRLYVEITNRCNLDCIMCVRQSWETEEGDLPLTTYESLMDQLKDFPHLEEIIIGGLGEPLVHPKIEPIIMLTKQRGYKTSITTNGMLLSEGLMKTMVEAKLDGLIISCDSFSGELFSSIRRKGKISSLFEKLRCLNDIKAQAKSIFPRVHLEFVLMKSNRSELKELPKIARQLNALSVLVSHVLPHTKEMTREIMYHRGSDMELEEEKMPMFWPSPVQGFATMCTVNMPRMYWGAQRRCRFVSRKAAVVRFDGSVAPCYALLHPNQYYIFGRKKRVRRQVFGNIKTDALKNIWISKDYVKFRHRVRLFLFPSCEDCKLKNDCEYPLYNEDCWGNAPSCADCLWAQDIVKCP